MFSTAPNKLRPNDPNWCSHATFTCFTSVPSPSRLTFAHLFPFLHSYFTLTSPNNWDDNKIRNENSKVDTTHFSRFEKYSDLRLIV